MVFKCPRSSKKVSLWTLFWITEQIDCFGPEKKLSASGWVLVFSLFGFGESVRKLHSFFMWLIISSITFKYVIAAINLCIYISDHVCVWLGTSCCKIFRQWSKDPSFIQLDKSKKNFFLLAYTYFWDHYTEDCRSVLIQIAAYPGSLVLQHKIFRWGTHLYM